MHSHIRDIAQCLDSLAFANIYGFHKSEMRKKNIQSKLQEQKLTTEEKGKQSKLIPIEINGFVSISVFFFGWSRSCVYVCVMLFFFHSVYFLFFRCVNPFLTGAGVISPQIKIR